MSVEFDSDAEIFGNLRSPIDPKTPLPKPVEWRLSALEGAVDGAKAGLGLLLEQLTALRGRVASAEDRLAALENNLSDDGR